MSFWADKKYPFNRGDHISHGMSGLPLYMYLSAFMIHVELGFNKKLTHVKPRLFKPLANMSPKSDG